jgi:hypothetical protein
MLSFYVLDLIHYSDLLLRCCFPKLSQLVLCCPVHENGVIFQNVALRITTRYISRRYCESPPLKYLEMNFTYVF